MKNRILALCLAAMMVFTVTGFAEGTAATFKAGSYESTIPGTMGEIVIKVSFDDKSMTDIEVISSKETPAIGGEAMKELIKQALDNQTVALDSVSGATGTSRGFIRALEDAVRQAGVDPKDFAKPVAPVVYEDTSADMVVVGGGLAGLSAAAQGAEKGLKVILVEQLGVLGGSSFAAGFLVGANTKAQKAAGVTSDTLAKITYGFNQKDPMVDPGLSDQETIDYVIAEAGNTIDWFLDMGAKIDNVTFQDDIFHFASTPANVAGSELIPILQKKMEEKGVDYRVNNKAVEILMDGDTAVGVKVQTKDGQQYDIKAKGVSICTGGYFASPEMVKKYKPEFSIFDKTSGGMGADGSGMLIAEKAGAELVYMDQGSLVPFMLILRSGIAAVFPAGLVRGRGALLINLEGKRFIGEGDPYLHIALEVVKQKEGRAFLIFDQDGVDLVHDARIEQLAGEGYIKVGDTLKDLADKLGIDGEELEKTGKRYGEFVRAGEDKEFARPQYLMRTDFSRGPFYGIEVTPCMHTTFGGIAIDAKSHVLRPDGSIIKGLYAAGECTPNYLQGLVSNTVSAVYGRLSADMIAEEMVGK